MEPVNMIVILPECSQCIPRLMAEEPASTAEGQFVRRLTEPLGCSDPFSRSWTLAFMRNAFNDLNKWLLERVKRLGAPEKRRLLEYEEGTKIILDTKVSVQSMDLTIREDDLALAAWLVEHMWEMRDHRTGRTVAILFLGPQVEKTLASGTTDYELISDARGKCFFFKAIVALPSSGRPCVRFSEGNRCRYWSTHIRLMPSAAPEKEMCEHAKTLGQLLPTLEDEEISHTDRYITLNMCLDVVLAIWRWCECKAAQQWRTSPCISRLLGSIQRSLEASNLKIKDAVLLGMIKTVQFHTARAISGLM